VASNPKEPYILLTEYQNLYKEKYGKALVVNKFREKWAMQDVIDSVGFNKASELLKYYFHTAKSGHPLNFFYNNFDRMDAFMENAEKDKEVRRKLREATKRLVEGEE
jgi:hypothetical protein